MGEHFEIADGCGVMLYASRLRDGTIRIWTPHGAAPLKPAEAERFRAWLSAWLAQPRKARSAGAG